MGKRVGSMEYIREGSGICRPVASVLPPKPDAWRCLFGLRRRYSLANLLDGPLRAGLDASTSDLHAGLRSVYASTGMAPGPLKASTLCERIVGNPVSGWAARSARSHAR